VKFTVYAPFYTDKSGGHWVLHFLCDQLNKLGHQATISFFEGHTGVNPEFNTPIGHDPEAIVIYPEVITDNPLKADKVVRYLLNREGVMQGKMIEWGKTDFPLAFSKAYRSDCNTLFYANTDTNIFKNMSLDRTYNSYYIGKGRQYAHCDELPGCVEITRTFPARKEDLAIILNQSKILFTYDTASAINLDAVLCGAMPFFMMKPFEWLKDNEYGKFWIESLDLVEVAQVKEHNLTLPAMVKDNQKTFPERLARMVDKIQLHFNKI
jgi:hypothetical protein